MHQKVSNVLFLLQSFEVVDLVRDYFAKFGNDAPPQLLKGAIDELEAAYNEPTDRQRIVAAIRKKAENHLWATALTWVADEIETGVL